MVVGFFFFWGGVGAGRVCVCVFDPPPKIMKIKTKIRYDLSTLKTFCTTKEAINKTKNLQSGRKYLPMK